MALYRFGFNLGMAFQLADDRLDYSADHARLGKSLGQDIRQGHDHASPPSSPPNLFSLRTGLVERKNSVAFG